MNKPGSGLISTAVDLGIEILDMQTISYIFQVQDL